MKSRLLPILLTGMTLGTTWAIRGQFGHEQGAAWAGGIACLLLILFAKRKEWISGAFKASLLGAIGWGMGGMMSYGQLVGYGRMNDFPNVAYALLTMFIVGGLYGFIGGGLFSLGLQESSWGKKIAWHQLAVEMVAGAVIFYYFVIEQLGMLMTPPRSEAWAVCAGAAIALAYFCYRNGYSAPLKVAIYAGLGGGFGFAFGEVLLVLGAVSELNFNFWNVMEYSLGFFGGIGMAYGVLTADFGSPLPASAPSKSTGAAWPIFGLMALIPFIVWHQSFGEKDQLPAYEVAMPADPAFWANMADTLAFAGFLLTMISGFVISNKWKQRSDAERLQLIKWSAIILFGMYLIYTFLITGAYLSVYRPEQYLYLVNFAVIVALMPACSPVNGLFSYRPNKALYLLLGVLVTLLILAAVTVSSHDGLRGAKGRFGAEVEAEG
jgi:hypothetical protein